MGATNVKAVNSTKIDAGGAGDYVIGRGLYAGTLKAMTDTYTTAALEAGSTIKVATPPVGSKIVGIRVASTALGSGVTLALGEPSTAGTGYDVDRYMSATSFAAAASVDALRPDTGFGYVIGTCAADATAYLTTAGATMSASATITVLWLYV